MSDKPHRIRTLLVANRGEIACRVIRTARRLGLRTVAVYSDADADALHARLADEAHHVGPARPTESYLNMDAILAVAKASRADAVHPGYGFLSENPTFARRCAEAGLIFVGPSAETMEKMASKAEAKKLMEAAGVPTVPGYHGDDQRLETLTAEAERVGFPLMIKAAAGGGGKGMRIVRDADQFTAALESAMREAAGAFGDDHVILERYITEPRHVEVQVFGDTHGNTVHLYERDCSSQRRYQKIIEEAPSPGLDDATRAAMHQAGVEAARAVDYVNAGTVEFIVDVSGEFFFMEMNTRLQVEHPVTEAITGQDLVEWQLRIAGGEPIPLAQDDIPLVGHAMEARIYAEDTAAGFLPSSGLITWMTWPDASNEGGWSARIDSGVGVGAEVTVHYDPMIAKLIVHGDDREQATARLNEALARSAIAGPKTNLDFLAALVAHERFQAGRMHTAFLDAELESVCPTLEGPGDLALIAGAVVTLLSEEYETRDEQLGTDDPYSPWARADGWRLGHHGRRVVSLRFGAAHHHLDVTGHDGRYSITVQEGEQEAAYAIEDARWIDGRLELLIDGTRYALWVPYEHPWLQVAVHGRLLFLVAEDPFAAEAGDDAGQDRVVAPMPGRVVALPVKPGDAVSHGQDLAIMEAMKMELTLPAPRDGVVATVEVAEGDVIEADTVLVSLEIADD